MDAEALLILLAWAGGLLFLAAALVGAFLILWGLWNVGGRRASHRAFGSVWPSLSRGEKQWLGVFGGVGVLAAAELVVAALFWTAYDHHLLGLGAAAGALVLFTLAAYGVNGTLERASARYPIRRRERAS